ncbi:hypothetical protein C8R44DRAFT_731506 [Mycena epipterygia]|nr:hypothetical protein C8R44DRAFT_731506 [Mycena epipterygia]
MSTRPAMSISASPSESETQPVETGLQLVEPGPSPHGSNMLAAVIGTSDLVYIFLHSLSLHELVKFSHCSIATRQVVQSIIHDKTERMLARFLIFDNDGKLYPKREKVSNLCADFWDVCEKTAGGITGSVAESIWRELHLVRFQPNNIDIVTSRGTLPEWHTFLLRHGDPITNIPVDIRAYADRGICRIVAYEMNKGLTIKFIESIGDSVWEAIAAGANHTTGFILMTRDLIEDQYPLLRRNQHAVYAWCGPLIPAAKKQEKKTRRLSVSTKGWTIECSKACPVVWRHVKRVDDMGVFCWNVFGRPQNEKYMKSHLKWSLGDVCTNSACPEYKKGYHPYKYVHGVYFLSSRVYRFSRVLADGVYGENFDATRTRTRKVVYPSLQHELSFIDNGVPALSVQGESKFERVLDPLYIARMFGRVVSVEREIIEEDAWPAMVFRIDLLDVCDRAVADLYRKQERVLNSIIAADNLLIVSPFSRNVGGTLSNARAQPGEVTRTFAGQPDDITPGIEVMHPIKIWILPDDTWRNGTAPAQYYPDSYPGYWEQVIRAGLHVQFAVTLERYQGDADDEGRSRKQYRARLSRDFKILAKEAFRMMATMRVSMPDGKLHAAMRTVGRMNWNATVEGFLSEMDWLQLWTAFFGWGRMAQSNVKEFMRLSVDQRIDDLLKSGEHPLSVIQVDGCHELWERPRSGRIGQLPITVLRRILLNIPLPARTRFAATSRWCRHQCALLLDKLISNLLEDFSLKYGEFKLLQGATGAIISGSTITALVHEPFPPNDLDIYCGTGTGVDVVQYLRTTTPDLLVSTDTGYDYEDVTCIRRVWWLRTGAGAKINVIESFSSNPVDCVLAFHSSPPRGFITFDRLVHLEINNVLRSVGVLTPASIRVTADLKSQIVAWSILQKYRARGFEWEFHYRKAHTCGVDLNCLATLRNTADRGCLLAPLLSPGIPQFQAARTAEILTWSLKGSTCPSKETRSSTSFVDRLWQRRMEVLIQMPTAPTSAIDLSYLGKFVYMSTAYVEVLLAHNRLGLMLVLGCEKEDEDFVATRDMSLSGGSLHTYKVNAPPVVSGYRRAQLTPYMPHVLGEVRYIELRAFVDDGPGGVQIRTLLGANVYLRCPVGASRATVEFFDAQVATLQQVASSKGGVGHGGDDGWLAASPDDADRWDIKIRVRGTQMPAFDGLYEGAKQFVVRMCMYELDGDCLTWGRVGIFPHFRARPRCDSRVTPPTIGSATQPDWIVMDFPVDMAGQFLADLAAQDTHTSTRVLAFGVYTQNFDATRERIRQLIDANTSRPLKHVWTFKDAGPAAGLPPLRPMLDDESEVIRTPLVNLQCPEDGDRTIVAVYRAQEKVLARIIEMDHEDYVVVKRPDSCNPDTSVWFQTQLDKLRYVIAADLCEEPGEVTTSWIVEDDSMIEILATSWDLYNGVIVLEEGDTVDMIAFKLWLHAFYVLTDADVGRT